MDNNQQQFYFHEAKFYFFLPIKILINVIIHIYQNKSFTKKRIVKLKKRLIKIY